MFFSLKLLSQLSTSQFLFIVHWYRQYCMRLQHICNVCMKLLFAVQFCQYFPIPYFILIISDFVVLVPLMSVSLFLTLFFNYITSLFSLRWELIRYCARSTLGNTAGTSTTPIEYAAHIAIYLFISLAVVADRTRLYHQECFSWALNWLCMFARFSKCKLEYESNRIEFHFRYRLDLWRRWQS